MVAAARRKVRWAVKVKQLLSEAERLKRQRETADDLFREFEGVVYARCLKLLKDPERARDATQDVFVKLSQNLDELRDVQASLAWLQRCANNHCLNLLRTNGRDVELDLEAHGPRAPSMTADYERRQMGRSLFERLSTMSRAVAAEVLIKEREHNEVAAELGINRKTIGRKIKRLTAVARELFGVDTGEHHTP